MVLCLIFSFLITLVPRLAVQAEQSQSVSQSNFGAAAGRVIATIYTELTIEIQALQPAIDDCTERVQAQVSACESCIETLSCKRSSGVLDYLHAVATTRAAPYISTIENGLQSIADDVTNAASDIFETYGEGALNALATKFKGVSDVKNTLKKAAEDAINQAKKTGKKLKKKLKKKFGKRRRRYLLIPKREFPELTEEQRRCLEKCPDCVDLLSGDNILITSAICGDSFADNLQSLFTRAFQFKAFIDEFAETAKAGRDLLTEIWINRTTSKVTKISVWKSWKYVTYQVTPPIAINMSDVDPAYYTIVLYIINTY